LNFKVLNVDFISRDIDLETLENQIKKLKAGGVKYFITVMNLGTTMFGSIDNISHITHLYKSYDLQFKIHVDAAFGGFIYPFTNSNNPFSFENHFVDSISVDGHKILQAPFGTGIFLIRKGLIDNVLTEEASYVEGFDHTLCGSRSGANVIATWMILNIYGSEGISNHMHQLLEKTNFLCKSLNELGLHFFRNKYMNIITIRSDNISKDICQKYTLVPDTHKGHTNWWKIVVMEHVNWDLIEKFLKDVAQSKNE
jgi:glutamate/tyrosine decarboxylase-like PLP-dependent enzyme